VEQALTLLMLERKKKRDWGKKGLHQSQEIKPTPSNFSLFNMYFFLSTIFAFQK
jgi:hypothetical protein